MTWLGKNSEPFFFYQCDALITGWLTCNCRHFWFDFSHHLWSLNRKYIEPTLKTLYIYIYIYISHVSYTMENAQNIIGVIIQPMSLNHFLHSPAHTSFCLSCLEFGIQLHAVGITDDSMELCWTWCMYSLG
jgi:hypothetical protein